MSRLKEVYESIYLDKNKILELSTDDLESVGFIVNRQLMTLDLVTAQKFNSFNTDLVSVVISWWSSVPRTKYIPSYAYPSNKKIVEKRYNNFEEKLLERLQNDISVQVI